MPRRPRGRDPRDAGNAGAKGHGEEAGGCQGGPLQASQGAWTYQHLGFGPKLQNCETINFLCFKPN